MPAACRKYEDWAISPVGGDAPPEHLLEHVSLCGSCAGSASRIASGLSALERAIDRLPERELPAGFSSSVMRSLPAARWESRGARVWAVPAAAAALLAAASAALLHPLPSGLAEHSVALSALRAPLATLGEVARILGASVSSVDGSLPVPAGPVVPLLAAGALAFALRRLARRPAGSRG